MQLPTVSLRSALLVSLLAFCLIPSLLVGAVLYRSSADSIDALGGKIISDVAERVQANTESHLDEANIIFNSLLVAYPGPEQRQAALGVMSTPSVFENMAFGLARMSPNAPFWYLGTRAGEFYGVEYEPSRSSQDSFVVREQKRGQDRRSFYRAGRPGDRSQPQPREAQSFEPRARPWYQGAVNARARMFTPVYLSASKKKLIITLAQPVFEDDGGALGVFGADIFLTEINNMLRVQKISANGSAYLIDEQGYLVASSAGDQLFSEVAGQLARVKPSVSTNANIRHSYITVAPLVNKTQERSVQRMSLDTRVPMDNGDKLMIVMRPFGDRLGLKWTMVVAAPESDFAGENQRALRQALMLMAATITLGALLAAAFAYRLGRRFGLLSDAAAMLGRAQVPPPQDNAQIREVRSLARALHQGGLSLKEARADVEAKAIALQEANEHLEARVEKRTEQLAQSREEALQAAKAKAAFLATMSHEIRTPLNGVVGMTALLVDTPLNDEQRDYLHTMRVSSDQLLGVINDILDFSKIESGKLDLENEPLNLQSAVEEACDIAAPRAREKGLELLADSGDGVPLWVRGDVTRLRQVLLNFINNAVKFTERGQVVVSTRVLEDFEIGRSSGEGAWIEFRVKDSGIGIPPDRMGALFQSFTQVDASTTRKYGGTGLGLAICKRLAQVMGGDVGVESELGAGSTFWFTARLGYADTPQFSDSSLMQMTSLQGRRALVVDDTELNLRILNKQLKGWKMDVTTFNAPLDALAWLKDNTVDVVVTDMHMPGMDGLELTRTLRQMRASAGQPEPRVLMLTSGVLPTGQDAKLFDARMFKPYRQNQLFEALARMMLTPGSSHGAAASAAPERVHKNQSILVVDDNAVNLKVALAMLTKLGYDAVTANNGQEAVDRMNESMQSGGQAFAAVLMDANMPVMDGYEASRAIIAQHQHAAPPILALTASVLEEDRKRAQDAGMVGFLPKPLRIDELTQALSQWTVDKPKVVDSTVPKIADATNNIADYAMTTPANSQKDLKNSANDTPQAAWAELAGTTVALHMDWSRLEQFKEFDDDQLTMTREVIALFVADMPQRLADLSSALAAQDAAALARAAHALKGAASNVGALSVSDRCALLEQQAKQGSVPPDADPQVAAIHSAGQTTLQALKDWG